jgi:uncharacterized Fe-S cluster protein YjdI
MCPGEVGDDMSLPMDTKRRERGRNCIRGERHQILKERRIIMPEKNYLSVDEVACVMGISKSYAYKIVRKLNAELDKLGFLTVSGRINRQYFMERTCYGSKQN